jgi:hypothetical protein
MGAFIASAQAAIRVIAIAIAIGIEELILQDSFFESESHRRLRSFTYSLIFFGSQRSFFFFFLATAPQSLQR